LRRRAGRRDAGQDFLNFARPRRKKNVVAGAGANQVGRKTGVGVRSHRDDCEAGETLVQIMNERNGHAGVAVDRHHGDVRLVGLNDLHEDFVALAVGFEPCDIGTGGDFPVENLARLIHRIDDGDVKH
jgi:hypothetical protein